MASNITNVSVGSRHFAVVVGTPVVVDARSLSYPATVMAIPGATGSLAVDVTCSADPATATWLPWASGTVTAATMNAIVAPVTFMRFTAGTANGTIQMAF